MLARDMSTAVAVDAVVLLPVPVAAAAKEAGAGEAGEEGVAAPAAKHRVGPEEEEPSKVPQPRTRMLARDANFVPCGSADCTRAGSRRSWASMNAGGPRCNSGKKDVEGGSRWNSFAVSDSLLSSKGGLVSVVCGRPRGCLRFLLLVQNKSVREDGSDGRQSRLPMYVVCMYVYVRTVVARPEYVPVYGVRTQYAYYSLISLSLTTTHPPHNSLTYRTAAAHVTRRPKKPSCHSDVILKRGLGQCCLACKHVVCSDGRLPIPSL